VSLGPEGGCGGPMCDGSRFARNLNFNFESSMTSFQAALEIDRGSQRIEPVSIVLNVLFHQQPTTLTSASAGRIVEKQESNGAIAMDGKRQ